LPAQVASSVVAQAGVGGAGGRHGRRRQCAGSWTGCLRGA
jgi:hypothetical protein